MRFQNKQEEELWHELREHIEQIVRTYSGNNDPERITRVTNNWFDDRGDYDGRWAVIQRSLKEKEKILDMAAGYGTFLLHGLNLGCDMWGVEPESYKQQYFVKKISASGYPTAFRERFIPGWGEALPFPDAHFGLVTTYQTLEHVRDVGQCLSEMLRVLKPGGALYIRAPDYGSFFEPHYGIPFWPKMNKNIAAIYLKLLGRPLTALHDLNWVTEKQIIALIQKLPYVTNIAGTSAPLFVSGQSLKQRLTRFGHFLRRKKQIDLWVTKIK